jgi:hypothetical protein
MRTVDSMANLTSARANGVQRQQLRVMSCTGVLEYVQAGPP